jgi:hypothetical protein
LPLGTFRSAEGKAGPTGSTLFVPLRARLGPKSLSVTGPETAVGHLRSTEGKAGPTDSTLFVQLRIRLDVLRVLKLPLGTLRSPEGKAGPTDSTVFVPLKARLGRKSLSVTGPETAVGHFFFH